MSKLVLNNIAGGYIPIVTVNDNYDSIVEAFENTLSRDGTSPNTMGANLDMNSFRILNLPAPIGLTDPVRLQDLENAILGSFTNLIISGNMTAGTKVITPLLESPAASTLTLNATTSVGFLQIAGISQYKWDAAKFSPDNALPNLRDLGAPTIPFKTGYFGTSVATPLVTTSGAVNLALGVNGVSHFVIDNSNNFYPSTDGIKNLGIVTNRFATGNFSTNVVTPQVSLSVQNASLNLVGGTTIATDPAIKLFGSAAGNAIAYDSDQHTFRNTAESLTFATLTSIGLTVATKVTTPLVTSSGAGLQLNAPTGFSGNLALNGSPAFIWDNTQFKPAIDAAQNIGAVGQRVAVVYTTVVDSGSTGSLPLKTNNGTTGFEVLDQTSAVNRIQVRPEGSGIAPSFIANGTDPNVGFRFLTKGAGGLDFNTNGSGTNTQFQVIHTASATRNITVTGSNGGNPTISTTAGNLAITPSVVIAGPLLQIGTNPASNNGFSLPYNTSLNSRNSANNNDIIMMIASTVNSVNNVISIGTQQTQGTIFAARSGAGAPTTSDIPAGFTTVWKDTSGGSVKLYYNDAGTLKLTEVTSAPFVSAETAIGGPTTNTTVNHGLGTVPSLYEVIIRNKTAELGYSVGDEVRIPQGAGSDGGANFSIYADATVVGILQSNLAFTVIRKDTIVSASINTANWKYVFRAWK